MVRAAATVVLVATFDTAFTWANALPTPEKTAVNANTEVVASSTAYFL
jgi:hypothetical protein